MTRRTLPHRDRSRLRHRRGFNLIELLIAISITAALLTATMVALDASFMAYQRTTEVASTHTVSRLALHRMLVLIRSGSDFGPFPVVPTDTVVRSDYMEFVTGSGDIMTLEWDADTETLMVTMTDPDTGDDDTYELLGGVIAQFDEDTGDRIYPFTLEYELGRNLYRATIDLAVIPDDNASLDIEGDNADQVIRLVASAMPRLAAYGN